MSQTFQPYDQCEPGEWIDPEDCPPLDPEWEYDPDIDAALVARVVALQTTAHGGYLTTKEAS